jgi:hypothetical protein
MDMLGTYVGVFESLHHLACIVSDACLKSGLQNGWTDSHLLHAHDFAHALSHGSATLECAANPCQLDGQQRVHA